MKYNAKNMYKSCLRKKKYRTREYAENIAKKFNQHVYYCKLCGCYHLTKLEQKDE